MNQATMEALHSANDVIARALKDADQWRGPPLGLDELIADGRILAAGLLIDEMSGYGWRVLDLCAALQLLSVGEQVRQAYPKVVREMGFDYCAPDATCGQEGCTESDEKRYAHLEAPESFTEQRIVAWGQMFLAATLGLTGGILVGFHVLGG